MSSFDAELIERFGIDNMRVLSGIGINHPSGANNKKNSLKIYIPKYKLEMFQTYAIYLNLIGIRSISADILEMIQIKVEDLVKDKDAHFEQARAVLKELRMKKLKDEVENFNMGTKNE